MVDMAKRAYHRRVGTHDKLRLYLSAVPKKFVRGIGGGMISSIRARLRNEMGALPIVIGFACYTAWTEAVPLCLGLLDTGLDPAVTSSLPVWFRMAYCTITGAASALAYAKAPTIYRVLVSTRPGKLGCLLLTICSAPVALLAGLAQNAALFVCAACVAAACLVAFTYWVRILGSLKLSTLFVCVGFSFALSSLLPTALPTGHPTLFVLGCSAFAAISWLLIVRSESKLQSQPNGPNPFANIGVPEIDHHATRHVVIRLALCLCVWFFVLRAVRCSLGIAESTAPGDTFGASGTVRFALTIGLFVCVALLLLFPAKFKFEWTYRFLFLLSLVTVLCCFPALSQFVDRDIASSLDYASLQLFAMIMWAVEAALSTNQTLHPMQVATFCGAFWSIGSAAGLLFSQLFSSISPETASLITAALAILLACCYTIIFTEHDVALLTEVIPELQRRPFKERCAAIGKHYGLTEREMEIMAYVATGRDTPYIQEALSLSKNTVNFHRKNLYAKLGIHSKQELLDLVKQPGSSR